jgi:metal-responsive CopG/Arc/MetJ family transcriptional regulator
MKPENEKIRLTLSFQSELVALMDEDMKERFIPNRTAWITEAIFMNLKRLGEEKRREKMKG